jgi:RNA polymerase sigma-B factor
LKTAIVPLLAATSAIFQWHRRRPGDAHGALDALPRSADAPSIGSPPLRFAAGRQETVGVLRRMSALDPADELRASLREAVIREQMRYAWHITALYSSRDVLREDDVALVYRSLGKAVDGFDPESGESFLRYAVPVILREVKASRDVAGEMTASHRTSEVADALRVSADRLTRQLGRSPDVPELAAAMGECCEQIVESLDAWLGYAAPWIDLPELPQSFSEFDRYADRLRAAPHREALTALFASLENRAKRTLLMWFLRGWSQTQIAAEIGVSREQVSRLHAQSLSLLGAARANPLGTLADEPHDAPAPAGASREVTAQPVPRGPGLLAA